MELQQLKGFISVAKYGGFSQAAEKTFRSQPAVSLQIQSLEKELGAKLFDRLGPRKITLTAEGQILFDLAAPLLEDISNLTMRFNEARGEASKSSVKIATHSSVMLYLLPEVIKSFKKKFHGCALSILNRGRKDIISLLNEGEVDIGITSLQAVPKTLDYKIFARFSRILITAKNHPLTKKQIVTLEDIASYPLIIPPKGTNSRALIDRVFENKGLKYTTAMEITEREAVKAYVKMNFGISIINGYYLTTEERQSLFVKDVNNYFGQAERGIITRKNRYLSPAAKEFIKMILEFWGNFPKLHYSPTRNGKNFGIK